MKIFELHNAVARTLGDPVACTSSLLQDGVRYSTKLRADYVARAFNDVVLAAVRQVLPLPHKQQSEVIERLFPAMVVKDSGAFPKTMPDMAFLLSAYYVVTATGEIISIPIIKSNAALHASQNRTTGLQPADPHIMYVGGQFIPFGSETGFGGSTVTYNYVARPKDALYLANASNANLDDTFEPMWIPEVVKRCALYGQLDSGELGTASQAVPMLSNIPLTLQN